MLSRALRFPRTGDDWLQTVLIGGVLSLLGALIIPAILVNGYLLRVLRAAIQGDEEAPRFEAWTDMLVDGLLVWVVQLIYVGIPAILFAAVIGSFVVITSVTTSGSGAVPAQTGGGAGGVVFFGLLIALGVVLIVATYLLPAALANFARKETFGAAFDLRTVVRAAFTGDYLLAVVLVVVVSIVLGFVGALLSIVLVGIFVLFYLQVVVYHLFGQGFARGLDLDTESDAAID